MITIIVPEWIVWSVVTLTAASFVLAAVIAVFAIRTG